MSNHIGSFDPLVLNAVLHSRRIDARILAQDSFFNGAFGHVMGKAQHIPVGKPVSRGVNPSFAQACDALRRGAVVALYPEGRIGLDPELWPERGKSGAARMAITAGVPVVPLAQWGSHEVLPAVFSTAKHQLSRKEMLKRCAQNIARRPTVRAKFGRPMYFEGFSLHDPEQVRFATTAIMAGIHQELLELRQLTGEVEELEWSDSNRRVSTARLFRFAGAPPLERDKGGAGGKIAA